MSIILKYNYFYINGYFIHLIKGTGMSTHAAVLYANLTCGYLPELFSYDIVGLFLKNYFRFLDDVKYIWKENS